ncbi:MAG: hypothetical protein IRY99_11745 [Isosphaeraceae bacterium]|nr:hypothetical protein [Isosphaeraceae bacterium]
MWARGRVPCYWVADVLGRRVVAHHDPQTDGGKARYAQIIAYMWSEEIPLILDGREVTRLPVEELLA